MNMNQQEFIAWTIQEFRANHGRVGGPFAGATLLLLHTVGARTGMPRVNPLMYMPDGDRYLIFASKAGADRNPDWYANLRAHPDVRIEVGDQILDVRAAELHGAERDEKFQQQAGMHEGFARYQQMTTRKIPVIALTPLRSAAEEGVTA
jgi:deazaflavin-dependent oxidoreductase (nitroreductase family)